MPPDVHAYGPFSAAIGAAAFWMFIAIVVAASVAGSAFRHRETQKTIRQAIDKGQTLDADTLERLLQSGRPQSPKPKDARRGFMVGGIMLLALAGGMALIGWSESMTNPGGLYQGLGVGGLLGLLGVGLLVAGMTIRVPPGDGRE